MARGMARAGALPGARESAGENAFTTRAGGAARHAPQGVGSATLSLLTVTANGVLFAR